MKTVLRSTMMVVGLVAAGVSCGDGGARSDNGGTSAIAFSEVAGTHVTATSPAEGSDDLELGSTIGVTITFSAPMAPAAQIPWYTDDGPGELPLTWNEDRTVARVTLSSPQTATPGVVALVLGDLRDASDAALDGIPVLGDGELTLFIGEDARRPRIVASLPSQGETNLYPYTLMQLPGQTFRARARQFYIEFDEPMDVTTAAATLRWPASEIFAAPLTGTWNAAGTRIDFTYVSTMSTVPLEALTDYVLDVTTLRDRAGNAPSADEARIGFSSREADRLLGHSCGHTTDSPRPEVQATLNRSPFLTPSVYQPHARIPIRLASGASGYRGYVAVEAWEDEELAYTFYFDKPVSARVVNQSGEPVIDVGGCGTAVPPACAGISAEYTFVLPASPEFEVFFVELGPIADEVVMLILERDTPESSDYCGGR